MTCDWPIVRLGDYIDSCLGKMLDKKKNKGTEQFYLGNSDVRWGSFDLSKLSKMKFEENEHERYGIKKGDLIVCEGGEPGRCAIWLEALQNMKIQKALHRIRTKASLNNYYLYYWFLYSGQRGLLEPYFTGTTIKHLTGKALKELELPLPPLSYQKKTARILKSIDDKIELNRQINQTLEQIAQALFKSWFVDFEPTRAKIAAKQSGQDSERAAMAAISGKSIDQLDQLNSEQLEELKTTAALFPDALVDSELGGIPEGWKWSEIGKETSILGGATPSTKNSDFWEEGDISWTTPKDLSALTDKVLLDTDRKITKAGLARISSGLLPINTVLMSSRAPVGYLALSKIPVAINQGYIAMICEDRLSPEYIVQWADSVMHDIKQRASGTTFAEISKKNFKIIPVLAPDDQILARYTKTITSLYEKISAMIKENKELVKIRDSLLPKILSGELRLIA